MISYPQPYELVVERDLEKNGRIPAKLAIEGWHWTDARNNKGPYTPYDLQAFQNQVGFTRRVRGRIELCKKGLHMSPNFLDSLEYTSDCEIGDLRLAYCRSWGAYNGGGGGDNKMAFEYRRYLHVLEGLPLLNLFFEMWDEAIVPVLSQRVGVRSGYGRREAVLMPMLEILQPTDWERRHPSQLVNYLSKLSYWTAHPREEKSPGAYQTYDKSERRKMFGEINERMERMIREAMGIK